MVFQRWHTHPMFKAKMTVQRNGSTVLISLAGTTGDITDAFNSLFNWGAVGDLRRADNGLDFKNHTRTVAECWTTPEKLFRYIFTRTLNAAEDASGLIGEAPLLMRRDAFASAKRIMAELESAPFYNPVDHEPEEFATGHARAERPDSDFKDAVLSHAFRNRDEVAS